MVSEGGLSIKPGQPAQSTKVFADVLTLSQTSPDFYISAVQVFWKHWEKEKLLITSNFSFSDSFFLPVLEVFAIFTKFEIVVCKLFQFGRVYDLLFGKGLVKQQISVCLHWKHFQTTTWMWFKLAKPSLKGLITLLEKENMLVSNLISQVVNLSQIDFYFYVLAVQVF